jgi:hypothetical protein
LNCRNQGYRLENNITMNLDFKNNFSNFQKILHFITHRIAALFYDDYMSISENVRRSKCFLRDQLCVYHSVKKRESPKRQVQLVKLHVRLIIVFFSTTIRDICKVTTNIYVLYNEKYTSECRIFQNFNFFFYW